MPAPYLVGLSLLVGIPMLLCVALSFTEFAGVSPPRFIGLDNFRRVAQDDAFWRSLGNSLVYVAVSTPLRIAAAVGLALLLARRSRSSALGRPIVFLPTVLPDVAYALLLVWVLNPAYGPFVPLFDVVGDPASDPWVARLALPLAGVLQIGEGFVVALAARRALPRSLYEVAAVEGAGPGFVARTVTLPLMAPVMGILALRDVLLSFQMNFVPALLVTDGGPRYATTYLPLYIYRAAFRYFRLGYASAMSISMFVLTAIAILVAYLLMKRWSAGRATA